MQAAKPALSGQLLLPCLHGAADASSEYQPTVHFTQLPAAVLVWPRSPLPTPHIACLPQ